MGKGGQQLCLDIKGKSRGGNSAFPPPLPGGYTYVSNKIRQNWLILNQLQTTRKIAHEGDVHF